ncbi:MAG TPA: TIGR01777 family oxidoreductase [Solirubrobacterales bacterium]|nr:TIGR01777 family oxidoreductase [Solirubrobacterales bacterium]
MRVLVTGASGFLGSRVCDALLARGDEVVGLSRSPESARSANPTANWHAWNATAERPPESALEGVDAVINLIGEPIDQRWTDEAKQRIRESRERATKNLVDALSAADPRPRALISQSAVGYYGDRGDAMVDESTPPGTTFDAGVCAAWEAAARAAEDIGMRVAVIRTGLVLDPEAGLLKQLLPPFRLGLGGPIAGGRQYMPWIHVDDWVHLVLWVLDGEDQSGTFNGTAPNPSTNAELSKALGRVLGRPAIIPVPKLAMKARFGNELGEVVTGGQRVVPRRALDGGFEFAHPELEPALRSLLGK